MQTKQQLQPDHECMLIILHITPHKEIQVYANLRKEHEILHFKMYFALQVIASMAKDDEERLCHVFGEKE